MMSKGKEGKEREKDRGYDNMAFIVTTMNLR